MNLNLNQNQKREKELQKSEQQAKQQLGNCQQLLPQQPSKQDQQQVATTLLQEKQAEKQQLGWVELPDKKLLKATGLNAEKLKTYPGLAELSDIERENLAESLILFSQLVYEIFLQQQSPTRLLQQKSNKTVAGNKQLKQQSTSTLKKPKSTTIAPINCLKEKVK